MTIRIFSTYEEMSSAAADFIAAAVQGKPDSLLCLPSGDTPTATLNMLVEYARSGKVSFTGCRFVGLDEWVGMDKNDEGSCQHYLHRIFFDPLHIHPDQIIFFNAKAPDLQEECDRIDRFLDRIGPIDLTLVGVGVNGHIGLNEPGVSPDLKCHVVNLDPLTAQVAQKYFSHGKKLERGITLGLRHIMRSAKVLVLANGPRKTAVMQKIIEGPISPEVPGTILQKHPNVFFYLDSVAAENLDVI